MPATRDGEAVGMMHIRSAGAQRDMRRAGVDQERIDRIRRRRGADADHAVLGMEDHLAVGGDEIGDQRRDADAEVDQPAFGNVARAPGGHAIAIERGKFAVRHWVLSERHVQHAIDEDARRHDHLRGERAECRDVACHGDGQCRRHRHHRIEVPRAVAIGEVAPAIGAPSLDQCDVAWQRVFQQAQPAADLARLASLREQRVGAGGRIEAGDAGAGGAHAFGHRALRYDLHLQVAALQQPAGKARGTHEAADQPAHAAERQQPFDRAAIASAGDGDDGEIARALRDQAVQQRGGNADIAEATEQDRGAVGNACHGLGHGMHELVDHAGERSARDWYGRGNRRDGQGNRAPAVIAELTPAVADPAATGWGLHRSARNDRENQGRGSRTQFSPIACSFDRP